MTLTPLPPRLARIWSHPRFQLLAGILAVVGFALLHQMFLQRAHPDALYMDSLRLLAQLDQWEHGKLSTMDFWGQGSSHRGFVNQLFLLANVAWFDLDVMLVNRLTGLVIAVVALILVLTWVRDSRADVKSAGSALVTAGVSFVIAGLCYSWAGFELFTLDLGLPLWFKNLCFVAFFSGHAWLMGGAARRPWLWSLVLVVTAPVIVLVVGMGWNYAFIGAVLALQLLAFLPKCRSSTRWHGVPACLSLVVAMALYLVSGSVTDAAVASDALSLDSNTPLITLYALGSTVGNPAAIGHALPLWVIAVAGAGILLTGGLATLSWVRRGAPGSRLPLYLIAYGALVAVSVTLARGSVGPGGVMASRYYMDLVLGLIGVVWLTTRELRAGNGNRLAAVFIWCMLAGIGVMHLGTNYYEWRAGPYRALAFADMNRALVASVPDDNAAALLQSPLGHARQGADIMRERQLSVFADHPELQCSGRDVQYKDGWNAAEEQGRWARNEATLALPSSCSCSFVADLYIPEVFNARHVEARSNGQLLGEWVLPPGKVTAVDLGKAGEGALVTIQARSAPEETQAPNGTADEPELGALFTGFSLRCTIPGL